MSIGCELWVTPRLTFPKVKLPDRAADWQIGKATVLADVVINWGRRTVVDQPDPATCRFMMSDPLGGSSFQDEPVQIGQELHVYALGDIGTAGDNDVSVDGSFEGLPLGTEEGWSTQYGGGPCRNLSNIAYSGATQIGVTTDIVSDPVATGVKSMYVYRSTATTLPLRRWARLGPAVGGQDQPITLWDGIPSVQLNSVWVTRLKIRSARGAKVTRYTVVNDGPADPSSYYVGAGGVHYGDLTWRQSSITRTITDQSMVGKWIGTIVNCEIMTWAQATGPPHWQAMPNPTWADMPGPWTDYDGLWLDDLELKLQGQSIRRSLVFSGKITDLRAEVGESNEVKLSVTAVDQLGSLMNTYVGDTPWPAETAQARVNRLRQFVAGWTTIDMDPELGALVVSRRDVDKQPLGQLYLALATGIDAVLWSATHDTTGPYLLFENPMRRLSVGALVEDTGTGQVNLEGDKTADTLIDACQISRDLTWVRDVTDVMTRIDATWLDQSTSPDVTERWIPTQIDPTPGTEAVHGQRHVTISTPLTTEADAINVAARTLNRTRQLQWRAEEINWPLSRIADTDYPTVQTAMDLLDGTTRLGRGLVVDGIVGWPVGDSTGVYLDGGNYRFDENGWELNLYTSPMGGFGQSGVWTDLDPGWAWADFNTAIDWADLWGVVA